MGMYHFIHGMVCTTRMSWVHGKSEITIAFEFDRERTSENVIFAVPGSAYEVIFPNDPNPRCPVAFKPIEDFNYNSPFTGNMVEPALTRIKESYEKRQFGV